MMIISGFPGIGKTYYYNTVANKVADSDSSKFSWLKEGIRHPEFPQNYIDHIKMLLIGRYDFIFVSSHKVVRDALVSNGLEFTLAFPESHLKDEYLQRFELRGNEESFIRMIDDSWDLFMSELESQEDCRIIRLKSGEYLSDVLEQVEELGRRSRDN